MQRIRWEEEFGEFADEHEWLGYLGKVIICKIDWTDTLFFRPTEKLESYNSRFSAKRGAERMLKRFLDEAGLEMKEGK